MPTTKTKTSPSGLTPKEQKELERRGFLVKKNFSFSSFIKTTIKIFYFLVILGIFLFTIILGGLSLGILLSGMITSADENATYIFTILILFFSVRYIWLFLLKPILSFILVYLRLGKTFYTREGVIHLGGLNGSSSEVLDSLIFFDRFYTDYNIRTLNKGNIDFLVKIMFLGFITFIFIQIYIAYSTALILSYGLVGILLWYFLLETGRFFYQSFNPLYAFGNLGSKIQSLTPRITEKSEKIEKEFSTDMNFRTLSDSFDTLSKDFSQISSYVIKLETIEQKANKGNLFDSQKYIGSLREDIVKPLTALRSFLEKKKTELEESREEIRNLGALDAEINSAGQKVRVRVGGSGSEGGNGGAENLALQSKRSEPLISELTENIEKLDMMIEKFAKI